MGCLTREQLGQFVHCSVKQIRILKVSLIARLLIRLRLQTCRKWFAPFHRRRSNVSEDTFYLIDADVAREWDRVEAGTAYGKYARRESMLYVD